MKPTDFFPRPQKQSCHPVFETRWKPGTPARMDGYNQPEGQWHSFEVLHMVKFAFYHCRKHKSFNPKAVHTCRLHRTLLTAVPQHVSEATRVTSGLRSGEFQVKMSIFPRFVLCVGDDNSIVSTGHWRAHSSLPAAGRTAQPTSAAKRRGRQEEGSHAGARKAGRTSAHRSLLVCRSPSSSRSKEPSR